MQTTTGVRRAADFEIRDIECKARERENHLECSRVELRFGLALKSNKFILPEDNLIQCKILYKTNADCNDYWHDIFG